MDKVPLGVSDTHALQSGEGYMDRYIAQHNIEHFRKQLSEETDEAKLKTIRQLLAQEEEKLAALENIIVEKIALR
jgi:hypothetical protein